MTTKIIFSTAAILLGVVTFAQQSTFDILEKDYEISRKAKKGYLGGVEPTGNGGFEMFTRAVDRNTKNQTFYEYFFTRNH